MKIPGRTVHAKIFSNLIGVAGFLISTPAFAAAPFSGIISFGDSLTDVGNVAGVTTPGYSPVINGYYQETHFSDNVLWNETLASYWDLPAPTPGRGNTTTQPPLTSGTDWAWGGSEAGNGTVQPTGVTQPIPNLLAETSQYLLNNTPNSTALYTMWSGADNLLVGGKFGPQAAADAVDAVKTALRNLDSAGARHFLLFNMPKLGDTPSAQSGGPVDEAAANLYSDSFNTALDAAVVELRGDPLFHANIYTVDVYAELVLVVNTVNGGGTYTPGFFVPGAPVEINNVTDEGLTVFQGNGTFPDNYLFWDDVHPTTQGHAVIAGLALQAMVPEPASAAMVAGGLIIGFAVWRRRRNSRD